MYNTDYSISQQFDPIEEERKRREQELAALQNGLPPTGPIDPNQPIPDIGQVPTPGPEVQVAGPMATPPQPQMAEQADVRRIDNQIDQNVATRGFTESPQAKQAIQQNTPTFQQAFTSALGDEKKLWDVYNNSQYSSEERFQAGKQLNELMSQKHKKAEAEQFIRTATPQDLQRMMASRSQEGSWAKAIMYGLLGMENSAKAEASKLGIGQWQSMMIGNEPVSVKIGPDGMPISGYSAATGKQLDAKQLVTAHAQGALQKGTTTHTGKMQDVTTNEVYYEQTTPQGIRLVDNNGKVYTGPSSNLRPFGIGSDINTKNQIQLNELQNKLAYAGPTERAKIVAENEAKYGRLDPATRAQALGQVTGTAPMTRPAPATQAAPAPRVSGQPTGPVNPFEEPQPVQAAPAPVQQTAQPAGTGGKVVMSGGKLVKQTDAEGAAPGGIVGGPANAPAPNLNVGQREAQQAGRLEIVKKAGDIVASSDKIISDLEKTNSAIDTLKNKPTNFGTVIHGQIPGEYTIGQTFKTQDAINTNNVLDMVNRQAATNARMLGVNPTDRDLQFVTSTKPDETWSAKAVEEWLRRSAEGTRRTIDFARKQLETGGSYVPPTTPEAPTESLTPQQRAQQELEKRRKKKE